MIEWCGIVTFELSITFGSFSTYSCELHQFESSFIP